jgi:hypothetical protein
MATQKKIELQTLRKFTIQSIRDCELLWFNLIPITKIISFLANAIGYFTIINNLSK